jgi:hypothetical protein
MGLWEARPKLSDVLARSKRTRMYGFSGTTNSAMQLPSFFVIGPPRTGTSWLHEVLREHAHLPRLSKETRFFDTHFHRGLRWYNSHFPKSRSGEQVGEVAPTYFISPQARERIVRLTPEAKIVCIFRHPVDRLLSLYRIKRAYGLIPWGFEEALVRDPELMESGKYATHLKAWQRLFGTGRILPTLYESLRDDPQTYVNSLADFVGITRFTLAPEQIRRVFGSDSMTHPRNYYRTRSATAVADWCKARRLDRVVTAVKSSPMLKLFIGGGPAFTELSSEIAPRLYSAFRPEIEELEGMLNRDFSDWKTPERALDATA